MIPLIATLTWCALVALTWLAVRRYSARRASRPFLQFTVWQFLVLIAVWALLVWMVQTWWVDYFEPVDRRSIH